MCLNNLLNYPKLIKHFFPVLISSGLMLSLPAFGGRSLFYERELKPKVYDLSKCWNYKFGSVSTFGNAHPVVNCIAQAVDQGLRPLCKKKKAAQVLLEYYKNKGEDEKAEEVEEYWLDLKETQYELASELYAMADEFDGLRRQAAQVLLEYYKNKGEDEKAEEVEEYLLDLKETQYELADELYAMADEFDGLRRQAAQALLEYYKNKGEIEDQRSFTRMLDSRARLACKGQLDFSKIKNEGWTPR